mmetsp:Transcript_46764/g.149321  ORF Transcript_46764/g.149321 Transcript_46764/m.149321 type:complete len:202 (+) Transcript_46764:76-681(+)
MRELVAGLAEAAPARWASPAPRPQQLAAAATRLPAFRACVHLPCRHKGRQRQEVPVAPGDERRRGQRQLAGVAPAGDLAHASVALRAHEELGLQPQVAGARGEAGDLKDLPREAHPYELGREGARPARRRGHVAGQELLEVAAVQGDGVTAACLRADAPEDVHLRAHGDHGDADALLLQRREHALDRSLHRVPVRERGEEH